MILSLLTLDHVHNKAEADANAIHRSLWLGLM